MSSVVVVVVVVVVAVVVTTSVVELLDGSSVSSKVLVVVVGSVVVMSEHNMHSASFGGLAVAVLSRFTLKRRPFVPVFRNQHPAGVLVRSWVLPMKESGRPRLAAATSQASTVGTTQ